MRIGIFILVLCSTLHAISWRALVKGPDKKVIQIPLPNKQIPFPLPKTRWKCVLTPEQKVNGPTGIYYKRSIDCTNPNSKEKVGVPLICIGKDKNSTTMKVTDGKQNEYELTVQCN